MSTLVTSALRHAVSTVARGAKRRRTGKCRIVGRIRAVRLKKSRLMILPVQAVAEDIFIWTVQSRRIVNSIFSAPCRNIRT